MLAELRWSDVRVAPGGAEVGEMNRTQVWRNRQMRRLMARDGAMRRGLVDWWIFAIAAAGLAVAVLGSVACSRVEFAARLIAEAPNRGRRIDAQKPIALERLGARGVTQAFRVAVGPPAASLAVLIVDPPAGRPRGTILYLHGIRDRKETLLETAASHARRGYRGVLVDARGHGESSGDWITYGVQEVADYRQLLDALEQRGLIAGRLGVYGASYGGGVAVQLAAREPRVRAAFVLSPFCALPEVVHDRAESLGLTWLFDRATLEAAVARVGALAGVDVRASDGAAALRARPVPVLILHGRRDATIPLRHTERLITAADKRSRLVVIEGATHDHWTDEGLRAIWTESTAWFDRWLGDRGW